jgi:rsbT antagonist protein RsbS
MEEKNRSDLSIHISEGCLIIPIQGEIDDVRMDVIQKQILKGVEDTGVKGVVIDVSGVRIIEPYHAGIIDNIAKMIYLLGARTVLTGIRPGVAISLTDSNFDFKEIYGTAGTFEEGVGILKPVIKVGEEGLKRLQEELGKEFEEEMVAEEEIISDEEIAGEEEIIGEEEVEINEEDNSVVEDETFVDDEEEGEAAG